MSLNAAQWQRHESRMRRVIAHVHAQLDQPLDLNALSDIACMSPHHWHRIYHAMLGETLAQTVKRLRLHRAAGELAQGSAPITHLAKRAGYPDLQSFTRTFKRVYGLPPAAYRAKGQHQQFAVAPGLAASPAFDVQVRHLPAETVLALAHRGSYMGIGQAFDLLLTRVASLGLARPGMRLLGLYHDDPDLVPEAELRSHAAIAGCALIGQDLSALGPSVQAWQLPGGPHAVLSHTGPYASMRAAYRWLYGPWLMGSDAEPGNGPTLEEYTNNPRDTPPHALHTLISMPLRAACDQMGSQVNTSPERSSG